MIGFVLFNLCFNFFSLTLESPVHWPKILVLVVWLPKFRETSFTPPKGTSLRALMRSEPSLVQIGRVV